MAHSLFFMSHPMALHHSQSTAGKNSSKVSAGQLEQCCILAFENCEITENIVGYKFD